MFKHTAVWTEKFLGMNNQQSWVEALNISPEKLNEWSALAPAGKPLLVWCLEQGHVPVAEYLAWASDTLGLAVLSSAFFEEGGLDRELFAKHRQSEQWTPWNFPVEQWDGITYIACVEPPVHSTPGMVFVLADPRAMADVWMADEAPAKVSDAPDGIVSNPTSFKLSLDENQILIDHQAPTPTQTPPPAVAAIPRATPAAPNAPRASTPPPPAPAHTPAPKPAPAPAKAVARPSAPKVSALDETAALKKVFEHLEKTYAQVCVFRFTDDQKAQLFRAGPSVRPVDNGAHAVLDLSHPSFLRIVAKTQMPYHGYLVDSPQHKEFFEALGISPLPGCVTAVPIRIQNSIWGVVLATGPEDLQGIETLNDVVKATDGLVETLGSTWAAAS